MRITESQLRAIVKQELNIILNEIDAPIAASVLKNRGRNKRERQKAAKAALDAKKLANFGKLGSEEKLQATLIPLNLDNLANKLLKQDQDYVQQFLSIDNNDRVSFENFIGPKFKEEFQNLANQAANDSNLDTLSKFKELVNKYAPIRAKQNLLGTVARGFSSLGIGPKTKE